MRFARPSAAWARVSCLALAGIGLALVCHFLDFGVLLSTLAHLQARWFVAALALYGALFIPASYRWHLVLRLMDLAVSPLATFRSAVVGHFFYVTLFGVVGGDTARSALYSRWHRMPLPAVIATAPLDRLLGFCGLLLFSLGAGIAALVSGGWGRAGSFGVAWPKWSMLLVLAAVTAGILLMRRAPARSFLGRLLAALKENARRLRRNPAVAARGAVCGFLVQVALSGVVALNLQAVASGPLPWGQLAWTFPLITAAGALPLTFAGIGSREGAALLLLGLYGVSRPEATAAAMLTMFCSLAWAGIGGLVLWRANSSRAVKLAGPVKVSSSRC